MQGAVGAKGALPRLWLILTFLILLTLQTWSESEGTSYSKWWYACVCSMDCSTSGSSMRFSRQEYWSGLLFPSQRDLPNPGMELLSLGSPALAGRFFTTEPPPWESVQSLSRLRLFATRWTVARQAPLSMGFSGQDYRVGCCALPQGIFQTQGPNPCPLVSCIGWWALYH